KARRRAAVVVRRLSRHRRGADGAGRAGARPRGEPNTGGAAAVSGSCHRGPARGERARPPSRRPRAPPGGDVAGGSGAAGAALARPPRAVQGFPADVDQWMRSVLAEYHEAPTAPFAGRFDLVLEAPAPSS